MAASVIRPSTGTQQIRRPEVDDATVQPAGRLRTQASTATHREPWPAIPIAPGSECCCRSRWNGRARRMPPRVGRPPASTARAPAVLHAIARLSRRSAEAQSGWTADRHRMPTSTAKARGRWLSSRRYRVAPHAFHPRCHRASFVRAQHRQRVPRGSCRPSSALGGVGQAGPCKRGLDGHEPHSALTRRLKVLLIGLTNRHKS